MKGAALNRQGRLFHRFGQSWVRVASAGNIFRAGRKFHGHGRFGNQSACLSAQNMHPKHAIRLGIGKNYNKPFSRAIDLGATIGGKRKFTDHIINAIFFQLLF